MNKRNLIIGGLVVLVVVALGIFLLLRDPSKPGAPGGGDAGGGDAPSGTEYAGAPDPARDIEKYEQIKRLWPDLGKKGPKKEDVIKEWREFAAKYPNNFYLPPEFKAELNEEQRKAQQKRLETFGSMDASFANFRAKAKYLKPGAKPPEFKGDYTPEELKTYFTYRIKELESRIQLLEFAMSRKGLDPDQERPAKQELAQWNQELTKIKGLRDGIKREGGQ